MSNLLQFPIKKHTVTQIVHEGEIYYCYMISFWDNLVQSYTSVWARDDRHAKDLLTAIAFSGQIAGRLKDMSQVDVSTPTEPSSVPLPEMPT